MNNIKRSSILLSLMILSFGSNLLSNNDILFVSQPVSSASLIRNVLTSKLGIATVLGIGAFAGYNVWNKINSGNKAIEAMKKLPDQWGKNSYTSVDKLDEYNEVRKNFHWTAWRLKNFNYTPFKIFTQTVNAKKPVDFEIFQNMIDDIKATENGRPVAFVFDGTHGVNASIFDINEKKSSVIAGKVKNNIKYEIKELGKAIKTLPYSSEIEKQFLKKFTIQEINGNKLVIDVLHNFSDEVFYAALSALENDNTNPGIHWTLDQLLKGNSYYNKCCQWRYKDYQESKAIYVKLIPLYVRLVALNDMLQKYISLAGNSDKTGFHADVDIKRVAESGFGLGGLR